LIMNYHVSTGSSTCVDHGVNIPELTMDYEGRPRPLLGAYDIGLYEYPGVEGPGGTVDLAAESMWLGKAEYFEGEDVKIGCNIRNWGTRNSTVCMYSVRLDGAEVTKGEMGPVAEGGGASIHRDIILGKLSAGAHEVRIVADADNQIADNNPNNNVLIQEIAISASADLQIVSMKVNPHLPKVGDYTTITVTVHNASTVDVPMADVRLTYYPIQRIHIGPNETVAVDFGLGQIGPKKYSFISNVLPQYPVREKDGADNSCSLKFGVGQKTGASELWILY
jgi:hypothetical protein